MSVVQIFLDMKVRHPLGDVVVKIIQFLFVPVVLAIVLSGCSGSVSKPVVKSDPNVELLGSWYRSETEIDSGGREEQNEIVLTLTPDRYIYYVIEYDENGELESADYWSGEWVASEAAINTKTRWWNRQEQRWSDIVSYEKSYTLDGNLQVDEWNQFDPDETPAQETYTRHQGISDITGTWFHSYSSTDEVHTFQIDRSFVITASRFREEVRVHRDDVLIEDWYIEGNITVDYSLNYLHVEITDHEVTLEDGEPFQGIAWKDHTVRYAFAPTSDQNTVAISRPWDEQYYVEEENAWKDLITYPWGQYWVLAERQ